jgi:3-oxoacyl-[acyl-carrier protein] reductase
VGTVAIVTGAGHGIGRAYARRLGVLGSSVVVADLDADATERVAAEITAAGGHALGIHVDVSDEAMVTRMAEETVRAFGRIDILINNAAIFLTVGMSRVAFDEIAVAEWDRMMSVNVRGTWLACKAVVPQMRRQAFGRIINISSGVVFMGRPHYLHYVASKGAVMAMTRAMARELGDFGINVNCITPGATYTEVPRETVTPEQRDAMVKLMCLKRPEVPKDLEGTVVFLASDDAAFITGQTINVDGGMNFH